MTKALLYHWEHLSIGRARNKIEKLSNNFVVLQSFPTMSMPRIQTDVNLPPPKKLAPPDSKAKERLFVVFSPATLPTDVLEDVFW